MYLYLIINVYLILNNYKLYIPLLKKVEQKFDIHFSTFLKSGAKPYIPFKKLEQKLIYLLHLWTVKTPYLYHKTY
jgi:hypothetical protein